MTLPAEIPSGFFASFIVEEGNPLFIDYMQTLEDAIKELFCIFTDESTALDPMLSHSMSV